MEPVPKQTHASVTQDHVLGGRVALRQGVNGYRAGMDAALLADPGTSIKAVAKPA